MDTKRVCFYIYLFALLERRVIDRNPDYLYSYIPYDKSFRNNQYCIVYRIVLQSFLKEIRDIRREHRNI